MRILYSPVVSKNKDIRYSFKKDKIIAIIDNITDEFDFSNILDGELKNVETILPINPIISAQKENGVLSVVLVNFIEETATEEEEKFPKWQEV